MRYRLKTWLERQMSAAPVWVRRPLECPANPDFDQRGRKHRRAKTPSAGMRPMFVLQLVSVLVMIVYVVGNVVLETIHLIFVPPKLSAAPKLLEYRRLIARMNLRRSDSGIGLIAEYKPQQPRWLRPGFVMQIPSMAENTEAYEYKPHDAELDDPKGASFDL
jgi:hypothetical protein